MAEEFNESDKEVLMDDYGFSEEDIERLESLDMDKDEMFSEIMAWLADDELTPEEVITKLEDILNQEPELPQQGGKRKRSKKYKSRKGKSRKGKSRKGKSRKNKSRKNKRR